MIRPKPEKHTWKINDLRDLYIQKYISSYMNYHNQKDTLILIEMVQQQSVLYFLGYSFKQMESWTDQL